MKKTRGFEVAKGWEDKDIHIPERKTAHSAGYDVEAAEDIIIPKFTPGMSIIATAPVIATIPAIAAAILRILNISFSTFPVINMHP